MAKSNTVRMAMDPKSWGAFKAKLDRLEKAAKKEVVDKALAEGGEILRAAASSGAPGPGIVAEVTTGRTLKKKKRSAGVKANARVVAVGADEDHWHYRWSEFGARPHDVVVRVKSALKLYPFGTFSKSATNAGGTRKFAFLRRAFETKGDAAIQAMKTVLAKEIARLAR